MSKFEVGDRVVEVINGTAELRGELIGITPDGKRCVIKDDDSDDIVHCLTKDVRHAAYEYD